MRIKKAELKAIIKEELSAVLTEQLTLGRMRQAYNALDKMSTGYSVYQDASKSNWGGVALTAAEAKWVTSPYAIAVLFMFSNVRSATKEWNALPYNHPFKIKHREYLKRAKALKKDERRRARIEKYGYDPKEEVFKKNSFVDAKDMLQKLYGSKKEKAQLAPEDEDAILKYVMKGKK